MSAKPSNAPSPRRSRKAEVEVTSVGDAALVKVSGMLDEHFAGFGDLSAARVAVLDVSGVMFITSFGVRQWLRAMAAVPHVGLYLVGCQRIFVEQLNMILNFGGTAQVLTLNAPYRCRGCNAESSQPIDAVAEARDIMNGRLPERQCAKCGGKLDLDEMPEMYFACLGKYGPRSVDPAIAPLMASDTTKLPKQIIKPQAPAKRPIAAPKEPGRRSPVVGWIVVGLLLAAIVAAMYVFVGPS